jgi:hypothetical protein
MQFGPLSKPHFKLLDFLRKARDNGGLFYCKNKQKRYTKYQFRGENKKCFKRGELGMEEIHFKSDAAASFDDKRKNMARTKPQQSEGNKKRILKIEKRGK